MPFSLTEVVLDPDLAEHSSANGTPLTIIRSQGQYGAGGWVNTETTISAYGVWTVADSKAIARIPQGDQITGAMHFVSATPLYQTSEDQGRLSDKISWNGILYKVMQLGPWGDFGFWEALCVRMPGQ
jgi:hypothetical protein